VSCAYLFYGTPATPLKAYWLSQHCHLKRQETSSNGFVASSLNIKNEFKEAEQEVQRRLRLGTPEGLEVRYHHFSRAQLDARVAGSAASRRFERIFDPTRTDYMGAAKHPDRTNAGWYPTNGTVIRKPAGITWPALPRDAAADRVRGTGPAACPVLLVPRQGIRFP
jgi:hypothetical protein